jgi:hypothetical protein
MKKPKFSPERERQLLDSREDPVNRANAITCMQSDGIVRHEDLIVSFIDHESPDLRAAAIKILLRWGRFGYLQMALDWLKHDPDEHVRGVMTSAVAHVGQHFDLIARAMRAARIVDALHQETRWRIRGDKLLNPEVVSLDIYSLPHTREFARV